MSVDKVRNCSSCGVKPRANRDSYCYWCLARKKREWRARNPEKVKAQRERDRAKRLAGIVL